MQLEYPPFACFYAISKAQYSMKLHSILLNIVLLMEETLYGILRYGRTKRKNLFRRY